MTASLKDKLLSAGVGALVTFIGSAILFTAAQKNIEVRYEEEKLNKKADVEYVKERDQLIIKTVDENKKQNETMHQEDWKKYNEKLDLILNYVIETKK